MSFHKRLKSDIIPYRTNEILHGFMYIGQNEVSFWPITWIFLEFQSICICWNHQLEMDFVCMYLLYNFNCIVFWIIQNSSSWATENIRISPKKKSNTILCHGNNVYTTIPSTFLGILNSSNYKKTGNMCFMCGTSLIQINTQWPTHSNTSFLVNCYNKTNQCILKSLKTCFISFNSNVN